MVGVYELIYPRWYFSVYRCYFDARPEKGMLEIYDNHWVS